MANTESENTNENVEADLTESQVNTEEPQETAVTDNAAASAVAEAAEVEEDAEKTPEENAVAEAVEVVEDAEEGSDKSGEAPDEAPENSREDSNENSEPTGDEPQETAGQQPDQNVAGPGKIGRFFRSKKFIIPFCSIIGTAILTYLGGALFYNSHFYIGTHIGSFDVSNLTPAEARDKIQKELDNFGFTFYEKNDKQETISGGEIGFSNSPIGELDSLKAQQNPFVWPFADKKAKNLPIDIEVSYNEDALYNRISEMEFMAATREAAKGKAQNIQYADGAYTITDDSDKNIVSLNDVFYRVKPKIYDLYKGMSLEKEGCYGGLENDDTIKGVLNLLNKYIASKITYGGSTTSRVLDGSTFKDWITVGDDYSVTISSDKVTEYVDDVSMEYNTVGRNRTFKTTGGSEITVSGGNYGWVVNKKKEAAEIINNITGGEAVEREPVYSQKAAAHGASDVANTYVEVSIGGQHMWYYKDGNLLVSSDVVTGNPNVGHGTPGGVYTVAYKARNVVLKGQGYESPVSYWMPFNGGIGLHDATWRGAFGGSIYRGGGSHGCVNLPPSVAQQLYGVISEGDPVVVY